MRCLDNPEIASFCQELAWLVHSGIRIADGLFWLAEEEKEEAFRNCLLQMAQQAEEGLALSEAVKQAGCFPVYVEGMLAVGEAAGRMEEALYALTRYYEEKERMMSRMRSALLYPSVLLFLMLIVIIILLTQVLPVFQSVFASLGGTLDGAAGGLLTLGMWLNQSMPVLFAVLAAVAGVVVAFSVSGDFRERVVTFFRKTSGDKGVMRKMNDANFAQAISMGLSCGLPLEETMELAARVLGDVPKAKQRCLNCKQELMNGSPLADALKKTEVFPPAMCRLLCLGVQSGNAEAVMLKIAERLSEEAEEALTSKVEKLEPTLVLVTSVLVGIILLSVMLPLMNIMETIG